MTERLGVDSLNFNNRMDYITVNNFTIINTLKQKLFVEVVENGVLGNFKQYLNYFCTVYLDFDSEQEY